MSAAQYRITGGTLTVDAAAGTFALAGTLAPETPPAPGPGSGDQIDLAAAVITDGSPDVRAWPIGAMLQQLELSAAVDARLDFSRRWGPGAWPFVLGAEGGEIQYTLWVGCWLEGRWHFAACIRCISRGEADNYVPTGPTLAPGQLPQNWYYFAGAPLAPYQPAPGESVAWLLTAGDQRRGDLHAVAERTQVVLAPFGPGLVTFG